MIWFTLVLFAVSFLLTALLAPKPEVEDMRPDKLGNIKFPQATEGAPVPMVFGRVRLQGPNTIWYGNFYSLITIEEAGGIMSSNPYLTGYLYYLSFDLALCLGPGAKVRRVWIDKKLWKSDVAKGSGSGETGLVTHPNLFGGEKKGGGFTSNYTVYSGEFNQSQNSWLVANTPGGADTPSYNGICHIIFRDAYIGTSASLKAMSFEVERYPDNLGLVALGHLYIDDDINPMEILYTAITEEWGGLGQDSAKIDTDSFKDCAETLFDEGNGMSLSIQSANQAKSVITEVLRQIDGILYQDPSTGMIMARLIRADYSVPGLLVFDESNVIKVTNFSRSSWTESYNQVRVKFTHRAKKYEEAIAMAQDMANINLQGGRIKSLTLSFPGITEPSTALKVATRELSQLSVPLFKITMEAHRTAAQLKPGEAFRFSWDDLNVPATTMRVQRFDMGELVNGRVVLDAVQDTFGVTDPLFAEPASIEEDPWVYEAVDVDPYTIFESPYWIVEQVLGLEKPVNSTWLWLLARRPALQMEDFDFVTSDDNFATQKIVALSSVRFTPSATLDGAVRKMAGLTTDSIISKIVVDDILPNIDNHPLDGSDLPAPEDPYINTGNNLIMINNEIMAYESYTDNADGSYDLENVHRALLDTTYEAHGDGDTVFFIDSITWMSQNARNESDTIHYRLIGYANSDAQEFDDVDNHSIVTDKRYSRPLPPDETLLGATATRAPIEILGVSLDVEWSERNRTTPDEIVLVADSGTTPEGSTTYNARLYVNDIEVTENTGIASSTGTQSTTLTDLYGSGVGRVEVESYMSSMLSHTPDIVEFFFAAYHNMGTDMVGDGDFESTFPGSWTEQTGSWSDEVTAYPLEACYLVGGVADDEHAVSDGTTNELRQDITIGAESGNAAVLRAYKGGKVDGVTSQLVVEIRDVSSALDIISTPVEAVATLGTWELIDIPIPLRTDATIVRIKLIAAAAGAVFDNVQLLPNTVTRSGATVQYDNVSSITPTGIWALRLAESTYSDALVRIRDTDDDSEADVGFDPDGNLEPY